MAAKRGKLIAMRDNDEDLPAEVEVEVGALVSELHAVGWRVSAARYDAKTFGNWHVELRRAGTLIELVKDRSQYMVGGPPTEAIKAAGLWRAFDRLEELRCALMKWAGCSDKLIARE